MPDFWLDSDVIIWAKNGLLAFDIAPRFWAALDELVVNGRISFPVRVYKEITTEYHNDELADWAKQREKTHFTEPSEAVEAAMRRITAWVMETYEQAFADEFLDGADPWLIAHAMVDGGKVVSREGTSQLPNPSRATGRIASKVRIPHACEQFNVPCMMLHEMLREAGVNDL